MYNMADSTKEMDTSATERGPPARLNQWNYLQKTLPTLETNQVFGDDMRIVSSLYCKCRQ